MSSTQTPTKKPHNHHHSHRKHHDDNHEITSLAVQDSDDGQARFSDSTTVPRSTKKPPSQTHRQILSDGEAVTPAKSKPVNRPNKSVTKINTPKSVSTMMYAGPAFHHSPAPSSLPTPKFAMRKASPAIEGAKFSEEAVQDEPSHQKTAISGSFTSGQSALAAMFEADREQRRRISTPQKDSSQQPDMSYPRPRTESSNYGAVDDSVEKSAALRRLLGMPNTTPSSDRDYKLPTPARSLFGGTPSQSQAHTPHPFQSATPPPSIYTQGRPANQTQSLRYTQPDHQNEWTNNSPGSYHSHLFTQQMPGPASPTPASRTRPVPASNSLQTESRPVPAGTPKTQGSQQNRDKTMEDQLKRLLKIGPDALSIDHQEPG